MSDRRRIHLQALHYLASLGVSLVELLLSLLLDSNTDSVSTLARDELVLHTYQVLSTLAENAQTTNITSRWLQQQARASYSSVVRKLSSKEFGWHFNAANARADQIENFRIEDMTESMQTDAPELWSLVFSMLSGGDAFDDSVGMDPEAGQEEHTAEESAMWDAVDSESMESAARTQSLRDEQRALTVIVCLCIQLSHHIGTNLLVRKLSRSYQFLCRAVTRNAMPYKAPWEYSCTPVTLPRRL